MSQQYWGGLLQRYPPMRMAKSSLSGVQNGCIIIGWHFQGNQHQTKSIEAQPPHPIFKCTISLLLFSQQIYPYIISSALLGSSVDPISASCSAQINLLNLFRMQNPKPTTFPPSEESTNRTKLDSVVRQRSLANSYFHPQKYRQSFLLKSIDPLSSSNTITHPQDRFSPSKKLPTHKTLPGKHSLNIKINQKIEKIRRTCLRIQQPLSRENESDSESLAQSMDIEMQKQPKRARIYLRKSKYLDRPSTIHFDYPKCCEIQNIHPPSQIVPIEECPDLKYRLTGHQYKCIMNALEFNGFTRTSSSKDWNIYFDVACRQLRTISSMNRYQKISHFPGCWFLGRKDYMYKVLQKMRRRFPTEYDFVPNTYIFPSDFERFQTLREGAGKDHLWIMKPVWQACGRGIKIITKQTKVKPLNNYLVSEYVRNPHLINGLKYDLRIYVVVVSYDPLKVYIFQQGLARFATSKYTTKLKEVRKRFIHLTNYSVNKRSKLFVKDQGNGKDSKWSLAVLKQYYNSNGIDSEALFARVKDVIVKTCIAAESSMLDIHCKSQERRGCGFQLYGFDILIDENLKPWLMEVNVCPSLSSSSAMDRRIKHTLLVDILNLIGLQIFDKKKYEDQKKKEKERVLTGHGQRRTFFSKNINDLAKLTYQNCVQLLSPQDWLLLFQLEEEQSRKGHFQLLFPMKETMPKYLQFFEYPRYNNLIIYYWLQSSKNFLKHIC